MRNRVTYARLDAALIALGFVRFDRAPHVWYVYGDRQSEMIIPRVDPQLPVRAAHLITARQMVVEKGIATDETFERELNGDDMRQDAETVGVPLRKRGRAGARAALVKRENAVHE